MDNNTLEIKVTNTETLLSTKEGKKLELNQPIKYGLEISSSIMIADVKIKWLKKLNNNESINIEIEHKNVVCCGKWKV